MRHCTQKENKKLKQTVTIPRTDLEALEKEVQDLKNKKDINIMVHFRNDDYHTTHKPLTSYTLNVNLTDGEVKQFIETKLRSQIDEHYNQVLDRKNEIIKGKNEIINSLQTKFAEKNKWSFWKK